jgi:preprotein translocase subunit SecB
MPAQLDIEEYFVEEVRVKANPDYSGEISHEGEISVSFNIKRKGTEPFFMIPMIINVNKTKKAFETAPYQIVLRITGFFRFKEGTDEVTIKKMIGLNAPAMLYSIARGIVSQTTAQSLHGKFILPTVNFVELVTKRRKKKIST